MVIADMFAKRTGESFVILIYSVAK